MIEIDELFFSVMSCRRYRSQMFLKIDVLRNFASFTRKHLFWSLFLIKFQAKFFYRIPPVAVFVVFTTKQPDIQCYNDNFGLY